MLSALSRAVATMLSLAVPTGTVIERIGASAACPGMAASSHAEPRHRR